MTAWPQNDGVALDPRHPRALGVCDYCGQTYHLGELKYIFQWAGAQLQNQHFRVCCRCWDLPQEQLRSIILPPDPIPVADPRPEYYTMDNGLQGFVQNTLNPEAPLQSGPQVIQNGVTQGWALPIPALTFEAITIFEPFVPQKILSANANRTYLLVYNPEVYQAGVGRSTNIAFGSPSIVMCGCATALRGACGSLRSHPSRSCRPPGVFAQSGCKADQFVFGHFRSRNLAGDLAFVDDEDAVGEADQLG